MPEHSHNYGYYFVEHNALVNGGSKVVVDENNNHQHKFKSLEKPVSEELKLKSPDRVESVPQTVVKAPVTKKRKKLRKIVLRRIPPETSMHQSGSYATMDKRDIHG